MCRCRCCAVAAQSPIIIILLQCGYDIHVLRLIVDTICGYRALLMPYDACDAVAGDDDADDVAADMLCRTPPRRFAVVNRNTRQHISEIAR